MDDYYHEHRKRNSKSQFYLQLTKHPLKTSSEIITEAKASMQFKSSPAIMNTKVVKTKRPFTPLDKHRILFGTSGKERPPSSINLHTIHFQESDDATKCTTSDNQTGFPKLNTKVKLPSINHKSMTSLDKITTKGSSSKLIVVDQREIHSSPSLGEVNKDLPDIKGFPSIVGPPSENPQQPKLLIPIETGTDEKKNQKRKVMNAWMENDAVTENKINEHKAKKYTTLSNSTHILLTEISRAINEGYENKTMMSLLEKLYAVLEPEGLTKSGQKNNSVKNSILRMMFAMIDSSDDALILHIARILLALKVTGPNLEGVCKIIYKVSRNEQNDPLFEERAIIALFVDCLGLAAPDEDTKALIYGYGALKFLTMNSQLLNQALDRGILQLMALHLKIINAARSEKRNISEQTNHILFQLTGCLRNIAGDESTHDSFSDSGILSALCETLCLFADDQDLIINIARTLSVLSTSEKCCLVIAGVENLNILLRIVKKYYNKEDIIIRQLYALGNVLATCESARLRLFKNVDNSLGTIRDVMKYYIDSDIKNIAFAHKATNNRSVDDVLVKITSVIANMSIDPKVGIALMCTVHNSEKYSSSRDTDDLLDMLIILLKRKTIQENEELVLSILSTLNNLSYYSHPHVKGPLQQRYLDITEALNAFLMTKNTDCMIEIARVYGNLTHSPAITEYILESSGFGYIIKWLDSGNTELLCATAGVLVNMMIDKNARKIFKYENGIIKLIRILEKFAEDDWLLATLVCQLIWNYAAHTSDQFYSLQSESGQKLLDILIDLLDEDRLFGKQREEAVNSMKYKQWEDFSVVATNILEKAESV